MNITPSALWIVIENDPTLKAHFYALARRSASEKHLSDRIRTSLLETFEEWKDHATEHTSNHPLSHWDQLMFHILQSALENLDDESVDRLAHHFWLYK